MLTNSILVRELLRAGRSLRVYLLRGLVPLGLASLMLAFFLSRDPQAGIHSFQWITIFFNVVALVAMPMLVSGVLHEEWQGNTLSVLILSETSLGSILRGLLASRVILTLGNLLAAFPVLISLMVFGGVTAEQLLQFALLMLSLTLFYGAFALLGTCLIRNREKALGFTLFSLGLPQGFAAFFVSSGVLAPKGVVSWIPSVALSQLTRQPLAWTPFSRPSFDPLAAATEVGAATSFPGVGGVDWVSLNMTYLFLALVLFGLSCWRVGRNLEQGATGGAATGGVGRGRGGKRRSSRATAESAAHRPIRGNPLSWLVLKRFDPLLGLNHKLAVALAAAVTIGVSIVDEVSSIPLVRASCGFVGLVVMAWTFFWACFVSAQTWVEERAQRTLELILATPYTLDEIILWKVDALFWALVSPTIVYSLLVYNLIPSGVGLGAQIILLIPITIVSFLYSYVALLVIVYLTIFFAIRSVNTVQAVLLALGSLSGLGLLHFFVILLAGSSGILALLLLDAVLFVAFLPAFRKRIRAFEPR